MFSENSEIRTIKRRGEKRKEKRIKKQEEYFKAWKVLCSYYIIIFEKTERLVSFD